MSDYSSFTLRFQGLKIYSKSNLYFRTRPGTDGGEIGVDYAESDSKKGGGETEWGRRNRKKEGKKSILE